MQLFIVLIILVAAVIYIGKRISKTFKQDNGICSGCTLSDICKKGKNKKKVCNTHKSMDK